jgi:ATP-dependent helicase HepA
LPAARRDIEVARFREAEGPSIMVSTEAGGEGRNFEFCRRLVLFDLPWEPPAIEQRIGRLDRIGRRIPVEVVYFRPPEGIGRDVVDVFEALRLFSQPVAGMEPQMKMVTDALERLAVQSFGTQPAETPTAIARTVFTTRSAVQTEAYRQLHRTPYTQDMGPGILERVPAHVDQLTEGVIVSACIQLGLAVERIRGARCYAIELGAESLVDSLPGVPGGTAYVGTFDREEAVTRETLDFFASGHALVEAVLAHVEDSPAGRVVCFEMRAGRESGEGIVAAYRTPTGFELIAMDASGRRRPDWVAALQRWPPGLTPVGSRRRRHLPLGQLLALVDSKRRPEALAVVVVEPTLTR